MRAIAGLLERLRKRKIYLLGTTAVEPRTFEPNLKPNPNRISNFEPIFGFEIRTFESRRVGSSRRFEKFGFEPTRRIRESKKLAQNDGKSEVEAILNILD